MSTLSFDWDAVEDFDPHSAVVAPSKHLAARETSALAAVENQPRRASQNVRILNVITAAGVEGLSDPEIQRLTGIPRQSITLRRYDLRSLLEPSESRYTDPNSHRGYTRWRRTR